MSDVYVFEPNETDLTSMGIVGALTPTLCDFEEEANGLSEITLEHPMINDVWCKHTELQKGRLLVCNVPVRTTPGIDGTSIVTHIYPATINNTETKTERTLYTKQKGGKKLRVLTSGDSVVIVKKPAVPSNPERWQVKVANINKNNKKVKPGTGWISPNAVTEGTPIDIADDAHSIETVAPAWTLAPQIFRIYGINRGIDSVTVRARHISYDLLKNLTMYSSDGTTDINTVLQGILDSTVTAHDFTIQTNMADERAGNDFFGMNAINAILDPEKGVTARFGCDLVRDNYELTVLSDAGMNRGVTVEYGKNMTGIRFDFSDDDVTTCVIPVGKTKDGKRLFLDVASYGPGGSKGCDDTDVITVNNVQYVIVKSPNHYSDYPAPKYKFLEVSDAEVKSGVDAALARARMYAAAQEVFANGEDLPMVDVDVDYVNLGDTAEYEQFKGLENLYLFDYARLRHRDNGIEVDARVQYIKWDCILDRMKKIEVGTVSPSEKMHYNRDGKAGENGYQTATIWLYKLFKNSATPSVDFSTTVYYNFSLNTFVKSASKATTKVNPPSGWSYSVPNGKSGYRVYGIAASAVSKDGVDQIANTEWTAPVLIDGTEYASTTIYLFRRASSVPGKPSNVLTYAYDTDSITGDMGAWSTDVPELVEGEPETPCYITQATVIRGSDQSASIQIPSYAWSTPIVFVEIVHQPSTSVVNTSEVRLYKRSASTVAPPISTIVYNYATGQYEGDLDGWSTEIPDGSDPCYSIQSTAISPTESCVISGDNWSSPSVIAEDGANGKNTAIVYLYKRSTSAPSVDWTGSLTYNFEQKQLTSVPSGWYKEMPSGTDPLYVTAATAYGAGSTDTIQASEWCSPVLLGKNGENGRDGTDGKDGEDGADGQDGADGSDGLNSATIVLYKRAQTEPTGASAKPSGAITYTFATGSVSGSLNGWSKTMPSGSDPCWTIQATAISASDTDTIAMSEWSSPPAKMVEDGARGDDGNDGKNSAIVYLYKRSTAEPTIDWTSTLTYNFDQKQLTSVPSGWSKTMPTGTNPLYATAATASGTGSTDTIAYTEWCTPVLIGKNGENGQDGRDGTDGVDGDDGADGLNSATVLLYKRSATVPTSSAAKPSGTITYTFASGSVSGSLNGWSKTIPTGTDPCWVIQATAASTGATDTIPVSEWTTPTKLVEDGAKGEPGTDGKNTAIVYLYKRSASAPSIDWSTTLTYNFDQKQLTSVPSGWYKTIPSGTDPLYVTAATACASGSTDTIASSEWAAPVLFAKNGTNGTNGTNGQDGRDGTDGNDGLNCATVMLYKRAATVPTSTAAKPSGTITYTFATGAVSGSLNGWTKAIPDGTNPCWVIQATAASTGTTDTIPTSEWSSPTKLVEDGLDGLNIATVSLYKRSASMPSKPTVSLTYTFSTGLISPSSGLSGWSQSIPTADGNPCYCIQKTAISTTDTYVIQPSAWSGQVIVFDNGENGRDGQDGRDGSNGKSIGTVTNYYLATNDSSNVTRSTYGWTPYVQSVSSSKKYLWNYEDIKYSDGTQAAITDPCIIGSYGRDGTNGTNGTNGRGITGVIEKYQISASSDPDNPPTTWLDSPPAMTTAKPYLWNYEITRYTTGDSTQTVPRVIGAFGKSVVATTHYYKLSATQPDPPNVSASGWQTTEPTYTAGSTDKLWHCIMTSYSDGSTSYSPVSEAYSNVKIDTFIQMVGGNTYFTNSANNAAVMLDSASPAVKLGMRSNGNFTPFASFERDRIEFVMNGVDIPAITIERILTDFMEYSNVIGLGKIPGSFQGNHQVELAHAFADRLCVLNSRLDLTPWLYGAGNFKLVFNVNDYYGEYFLTTSEPYNWSTEFYAYFTKSGSTYTQVTTTEAPTWEPNKYYFYDTYGGGEGNAGDAWMESIVEVHETGQIVEISGIISPLRDIPAGATMFGIMGLPANISPDNGREVNVICQGERGSACTWLLTIEKRIDSTNGGMSFSSYRNGSNLVKCPAGTKLRFHASWIRTYSTW